MPTVPRDETPTVFTFQLQVEGATGFFTEVGGLGSENEVIEQKGGDKSGIRKVPGALKWNDIALKRGVTTNADLYDWRKLQEDSSKPVGKDGSIVMFDQTFNEVARWDFEQAWPSKYSIGHDKTISDDVIVLEEFVLVPKAIRRVR